MCRVIQIHHIRCGHIEKEKRLCISPPSHLSVIAKKILCAADTDDLHTSKERLDMWSLCMRCMEGRLQALSDRAGEQCAEKDLDTVNAGPGPRAPLRSASARQRSFVAHELALLKLPQTANTSGKLGWENQGAILGDRILERERVGSFGSGSSELAQSVAEEASNATLDQDTPLISLTKSTIRPKGPDKNIIVRNSAIKGPVVGNGIRESAGRTNPDEDSFYSQSDTMPFDYASYLRET